MERTSSFKTVPNFLIILGWPMSYIIQWITYNCMLWNDARIVRSQIERDLISRFFFKVLQFILQIRDICNNFFEMCERTHCFYFLKNLPIQLLQKVRIIVYIYGFINLYPKKTVARTFLHFSEGYSFWLLNK